MHFTAEGRPYTLPVSRALQCRCEAQASLRRSVRHLPPAGLLGVHHLCRQPATFALRRNSASLLLFASALGASPPDISERSPVPHIAVFVSGGGSNFRAIHAAVLAGQISAEIAVVISDVPGCGGWKYAAEHSIATVAYPASSRTVVNGNQTGVSTEELMRTLKDHHQIDYVLLAGYLKLIPEELVRVYKRAMLNIHPALLPNFGGRGFYGSKVHTAVIQSGARFSGPTVHFVDEGYDTGPILAQAVVPVSPTDTPVKLAAKVLKEEHKLYPHAVSALVDGRITWRADGVPVLWTAS